MSTDDDLLFREESEHVEWKESHDAKDLLGRGVRRARAQLSKQGHPPLEVKTNGFTQVIVRRRAP